MPEVYQNGLCILKHGVADGLESSHPPSARAQPPAAAMLTKTRNHRILNAS
jgi:hypothetical protein